MEVFSVKKVLRTKGMAVATVATVIAGMAAPAGLQNGFIVDAAANNIISDFNSNFEANSSDDRVYWWNDLEWKKEAFTLTPYSDEDAKPGDDCEQKYLKIDGAKGCKLRSGDISKLFSNNSTYAYSYYYRISDGLDETVEIYIDNGSEVSFGDKTIEAVSDNGWYKVTGTFTTTDIGDETEIGLKVTGEVTAFDVDNLQIELVSKGEDDSISGNDVPSESESGSGTSENIELNDPKYKEMGAKEINSEVEDITPLKDVVLQSMNDGNFIMGAEVTGADMNDDMVMSLVKKHFNGITLGNELKLDSMIGRSCKGTQKVTLNDGSEVDVPVLTFTNADKYLDYFAGWNEAHPDQKIRIRGHVFVWHSQAPEWFFHEDYDANKAYVTPEVMNKRLEGYIKVMADHFTNRYPGLFYGWDVVNEAVSDNTGTYRNGDENSSWWRVYNSNEFIINAFRYANKYMPKDIMLFYNDYNDTTPRKVKGICQLISDVKAHENDADMPTRIDGFGMQAHYNVSSPSVEDFENAVKAYTDLGVSVQLTETDVKSSVDYDNSDAMRQIEYIKSAYIYKQIYESLLKLKAEGRDISGFTVWGVIDETSWLQTFNDVGGGANGRRHHVPLLFNTTEGNYVHNLAYDAFVNPDSLPALPPSIKTLDVFEGSFDNAKTYTFGDDATVINFAPIWKNNEILVRVNVEDSDVNADDSVTLFIDAADTKAEGNVKQYTADSESFTLTDNGYTVDIAASDLDLVPGTKVGFDLGVKNGSTTFYYNDTTGNAATDSKYSASGYIKPYMEIAKGTPALGTDDEIWNSVNPVDLNIRLGAACSAKAKLLWDEENLYVKAYVTDDVLNAASKDAYQQDSVEIFIDENNAKATSYEDDDKQYRVSYENNQSFNGTKCVADNITSVANVTEDGYVIEAAIKWTEGAQAAGNKIGIELQINDAGSNGSRIGTLSWFDQSGNGYQNPAVFGTATLVESANSESGNSSTEATTGTSTEENGGNSSSAATGSSDEEKPSDNGNAAASDAATTGNSNSATSGSGEQTNPSVYVDVNAKPEGTKLTSGSAKYVVLADGTVKLTKLSDKKSKKIKVPATITVDDVTYTVSEVGKSAFKKTKASSVVLSNNITKIDSKAFKSSKVKTVYIKSSKLTKSSIKNCLKGSNVTKIKLKGDAKDLKEDYKKIFTKKNAGKKVIIK